MRVYTYEEATSVGRAVVTRTQASRKITAVPQQHTPAGTPLQTRVTLERGGVGLPNLDWSKRAKRRERVSK